MAINHNGDNALATLRYRLKSADMQAAEEPFEAAGRKFNRGSFLIRNETSGLCLDVAGVRTGLLVTEGFRVPPGETYVAIESPRGEIGCYLVSDGTGKPVRLHIRGPSFYNLQTMAPMAEGSMVADTVAIISTVDPVMGEVDR